MDQTDKILKVLKKISDNQNTIIGLQEIFNKKLFAFDTKVAAIEHKTDRIFLSVKPVIEKVLGD